MKPTEGEHLNTISRGVMRLKSILLATIFTVRAYPLLLPA